MDRNDGRKLEELVAQLESHFLQTSFEVAPRMPIFDNRGVQIAELDIVLTGPDRMTCLIECRDRPAGEPAPGDWIEQLVGRRTRFGFDKVMAVSSTGFSPSAVEAAKKATIDLRALESLDIHDVLSWLPFNAPRMAATDRRRVMLASEFDSISAGDEDPMVGYYEVLINRNERIGHEVYAQAELFKELTAGQRMLIQLGTFDGQVKNGGINQFFWNCAESIFDVGDWIEQLSIPELQANYDRALEALVGKKDRWLTLRQEWADNSYWETFQQSYELLDLEWFDDAYFDEYAYNEKQEQVRQSRGLHHALLTRVAEYVRAHRAEFIVEPHRTSAARDRGRM